MSDSNGDISDELLELVGATDKKRKRCEGSSKSEAKRRKAAYVVPPCLRCPIPIASPCSPSMDTTSDSDGPESEEDDIEENPYPLEGKYINEYDRRLYTATFAHCIPGPIDNLTGYRKCVKQNARK